MDDAVVPALAAAVNQTESLECKQKLEPRS